MNPIRMLALIAPLAWPLAAAAHARPSYDEGRAHVSPYRGGGGAAYTSPRITVANERGSSAQVFIDRAFRGWLGPGDARGFDTASGTHLLEVRSADGAMLERQELSTWPGQQVRVAVSDPRSILEIQNGGAYSANVFIDGRDMGRLAAGRTMELQVEAGERLVDLRINGHIAASREVMARPAEERRLRLDPVVTGELLVSNPLPIPVQMTMEGGATRRIEAGGMVDLEGIPAGTALLRFSRDTGEPIGVLDASVAPFRSVRISAPMPTDGRLVLDYEGWRDAVLLVDGREVAQMHGDADLNLLIDLGCHQLVVRDDHGRKLLDRSVCIDPYAVSRVEVDHHHQGGGHERPEGEAHVSVRWN